MKRIGWLLYWLVAGGLMVLSVIFATSNLDPVPPNFGRFQAKPPYLYSFWPWPCLASVSFPVPLSLG